MTLQNFKILKRLGKYLETFASVMGAVRANNSQKEGLASHPIR